MEEGEGPTFPTIVLRNFWMTLNCLYEAVFFQKESKWENFRIFIARLKIIINTAKKVDKKVANLLLKVAQKPV